MHPLKRTPQSPCLLTETRMTASKFPRETARRTLPFASEQPRSWMCVLQQTAMLPPCCYLTRRDEPLHVWGRSCVVRAPASCVLFPSGCEGRAGTVGWALQLSGMTAGCFSQRLTDTWAPCRQAGMATAIEEHAAVVPLFSCFVYPRSHSRTDMHMCGRAWGGGACIAEVFTQVVDN